VAQVVLKGFDSNPPENIHIYPPITAFMALAASLNISGIKCE
jgi:hypothetical protein